ncbi:MAG: tyrosine--tRNA ligase [Marinilabiliales bacterium]|nr:MAG: tyrosine--tRNA ligase [Marinilabiliales bacterium]
MDFTEELKWRGMVHDMMPGTAEQLKKEMTTAYVGIDPTADSLHIGHLVSVMMLKHLQRAGHRPIVLVGGATGMIGDPSGKSEERNLLDEATLRHNQEAIKDQLSRFLDFSGGENRAGMVNNYDWMKDISFLEFIRNVGKHITVSYMMAKDSVKKRLETGLSFTEFSYQLVQGYDFLWLYENMNCKLQMGGSDQWGNIVTGTELIRRKTGGEAFALTCPLITKSDGSKFGKTEEGNVWLDRKLTSPYKFYQFWLNVSDEDAARYIKIFTILSPQEIEAATARHSEAPHERRLQKLLAREVTVMVHSEADYEAAVNASQVLFGRGTADALARLDEASFADLFEGVPRFGVKKELFAGGVGLTGLLTEHTNVFPSKGEYRRMVSGGGLAINREKVADPEMKLTDADLINGKYLLVQKGKKNWNLIVAG